MDIMNSKLIISICFFISSTLYGQDEVHLKDGTYIACRIIEISDFILYAEVENEPLPVTFFSDDVAFLKIHPLNKPVIRQLKAEVKEAMKYANVLEENSIHGFYFGMPYDSVGVKKSRPIYEMDSLGNPILIPYDPLETSFADRMKSLVKSLGGSSLAWLVGMN